MPHRIGRVRLVGAGPGSADLLTVRALRAIEGAQAQLYDALISRETLALAPVACLKIQTGKRAGQTSMKQATINPLMGRQILRPPHFSGQSPAETNPAPIFANAIAPSGPARGPNPAATTIVDRQLRKIVRDDVPCRVVRGHGGGRRPEAALERGPADQPLDAITMEGTR